MMSSIKLTSSCYDTLAWLYTVCLQFNVYSHISLIMDLQGICLTSCMITITFLGLQITKADVEELDSNDHPPCIYYKVSLAQEHGTQKGLFTLTATGIEQAGVGLLNIAITLHFDVPSQPAVHQVCQPFQYCYEL